MRFPGIYKIQSISNPERFYIGSAININERKGHHFRLLKRGIHFNIKIQNHYNKYGKEDLIFIILEPCFPEFLIIREQYYIDTLKPWFNICPKAGSQLGMQRSKMSKESRDKMSKSQLKLSDKTSQRMLGNKCRLGKKCSDETKQKLRELRLNQVNPRPKGTKASQQTIQKMRAANLGKKASKETRQKMSESRKKRLLLPEAQEQFRILHEMNRMRGKKLKTA